MAYSNYVYIVDDNLNLHINSCRAADRLGRQHGRDVPAESHPEEWQFVSEAVAGERLFVMPFKSFSSSLPIQ